MLSIVILAAGKGTRMQSSLPKGLQPLGGRAFLAHVVATAKQLSPEQLIVVYSDARLKALFPNEKITWVKQPIAKGTGDALAQALPVIPSSHRVLTLYVDVPLITVATLKRFLTDTPLTSLGILTLFCDDPKGLGRIVREKGKVVRIVEQKAASAKECAIKEVNTGIMVAAAKDLAVWLPTLTAHQKEYYLTDIVAKAKAIFTTLAGEKEAMGINDCAQLAKAERYYQWGCAEKLLQKGVQISDPSRFDVRGHLQAKAGVFIDVNVICQGQVTLQTGVKVGPHCVLIDCDIGEGTQILAHSYLEGVKVGRHSVIGPFARLRPGTVLADHNKIGNFVEVKNANLGVGTKVNHLSYIGDAKVGEQVNIGAGTVTCNYDGVKKHCTVIEAHARIGAGSKLIAPVTVGQGAVLGAGSVLKQDAPGYQLTVTQQLCQRSLKEKK